MSPHRLRIPALLTALGLLTAVPVASAAEPRPGTRHVLLISVDGLHQADLAAYIAGHPGSALAALVDGGTSYTRARTPVPSDSFPGLIGQLTGGDPAATGIYYDSTYNHALLPAGTTSCAGVAPGAAVDLTEDLDHDPSRLDSGQGLAVLPDSILGMTGTPQTLIDRAGLQVDPRTCRPVPPHS